MDYKLLAGRVVAGRRLQASHEGAVPQLRLSIGADQLQALAGGKPLGLLLLVRLPHQRGDPHLRRAHAEQISTRHCPN